MTHFQFLKLFHTSPPPGWIAAGAGAATIVAAATSYATAVSSSPGGEAEIMATNATSLISSEDIVRQDVQNFGLSHNSGWKRTDLSPPSGSRISNSIMLASSPMQHMGSAVCEGRHEHTIQQKQPQPATIDCDYVIIGHGKAGQSAVRTLRQLDPTADIVIIDPNNNNSNMFQNEHENNLKTLDGAQTKKKFFHKNNRGSNNATTNGTTNHLPTRATYIQHSHRLVHFAPTPTVMPSATTNTTNMNTTTAVRYRKSALLATGSRGAPPPEECIRYDAWSRILELRSTALPPATNQQIMNNKHSTNDSLSMQQSPQVQLSQSTRHAQNHQQNRQQLQQQKQQRTSKPKMSVLDPLTVRSLSLMAASQGARVAVMGSGWEALELAASLAWISSSVSKSSTCSPSSTPTSSTSTPASDNDSKKVLLLFGNAGPMSTRLPRYLSAALSKRLRQFGIDVEDRTMTRYISMTSSLDSGVNAATATAADGSRSNKPSQLEIYTVKSYDHLDSKRALADLLVLAPSVDGLNGTAVLPTSGASPTQTTGMVAINSTPSSPLLSSTTSTALVDHHQPWSSLISPPLLTCFLDDGRVSTNAEFHAASSIYAAGSVAKYPNARTGQAHVAGGTHMSAKLAGEAAARNMVRDGNSASPFSLGDSSCEESSAMFHELQESIPVWRSDVVPYLPSTVQSPAIETSTVALYNMGIHALCIGRCDSEGMATHGFWWTNTNQQSNAGGGSDKRSSNVSKETKDEGHTRRYTGPNKFMRRATRRTTMSTSKRNGSSARGALPVYGSGVVFYLDRSGNIQGVMLWGLPFSQDPKNVHSDTNNSLVERIKETILSNGGVAIRDHSDRIVLERGVGVDVDLLSYLHLVEESKFLASMALSGSSPDNDDHGSNSRPKISVLGRPLHRYTPCKSAELSNLNKMRRKDDMGFITEEDDLFYSKMPSPSSTNETRRVEEFGRPPSLKRIYPMDGGGSIAGSSDHASEKELETRQRQLERSRPPKEEPLWVRRGEANRSVNWKEAMADSFLRNMLSGQFSDGSDAVKQAPVPKTYLAAKDQWKVLTGSDSEKEEDAES